MIFYIGGRAQGKRELAGSRYPNAPIWDNLQEDIRAGLRQGICTEEILREIMERVDREPEIVIVCDEIGNGIVPIEKEERLYREETGRIQIALAKRAEKVFRVTCGLEQQIK